MNAVKTDRFIAEEQVPDLNTKNIIKILQEIKGLKDAFPQVIICASPDYGELKISNIKARTSHFVHLRHENSSWQVVDHQLPVSAFQDKPTNLQNSVRTYTQLLDMLQPFYYSLQVLDDLCVIGEPKVITPKTNWRLVKYSNKVFIKIEFPNPLCIEEVLCSFHGCTAEVRSMTKIYNEKCGEFDGENVYNKILNIFEIPYFPASEEDTVDCSICLSYRCESNRCPVVYCENEKCDSTFHISCLEKYLGLRKHVNVLSICIGSCPFCERTLSNSYAQFFQSSVEGCEKTKAN